MKKWNYLFSAILLTGLLVAFTSGCKKNETSNTSSTTSAGAVKLIGTSTGTTAGGATVIGTPWRLTAWHVNTTDYLASNACMADDKWTYMSDGTFTINQGTVLCDSSLDDYFAGTHTWGMQSNDTKLIWSGGDFGALYDITTLTDNSLKLSFTASNGGQSLTQTIEFSR